MTTRFNLWFVAAVLFTFVNLAGEVWAALHWELEHAVIHGLLMLGGVWWIWRTLPRRAPAP